MSSASCVPRADNPGRIVLRLIGAFQIVSEPGQKTVHLKTKKARSLLAYLAMQPHLLAQRGTLANLLWPDCTDANARHSLRQCLVSLRKELEESSFALLRVNSDSISLDPELVETDASMLMAVDDKTERKALNAILKSVRGDFLSDLQINDDFSNWASDLRRRVHQKLEEILHRIDEDPLTDDVTANAIVAARTLTQTEPFCEDCRRLLISLTARVYGRGRALAEYKNFADFLCREGSGEPEALTQHLVRQIEQLPPRNALPAQPLPDVQAAGAQAESDQVEGALESAEVEHGSPRAENYAVNSSDTDTAPPASREVGPPVEDQDICSQVQEQPSRPHSPVGRRPKIRWAELGIRMAAAAALFLALPLVLQSVDRFTHIDQAEATSLSRLMAEAQEDPILRAVPVSVRPFHSLTGDSRLGEQLREEISETVAKIPVVNMLADHDPASAAPAPYVLNGKIRTEFGFITLLVDLLRPDGSLLWREKFSLGESAAPTRDIAKRIGREIELALVKAEAHRAITRNDLSTRSLLLSARAIHVRGVSSKFDSEALKLYEKVLSLDNDSTSALAGISGQIIASQSHGLRTDVDLQRRAETYLRKAISIDPNLPLAHFHMGMLHKSRGQAAQAILSFNRALDLNPSFAPAYANLGHAMLLLGRLDEALENVRYAMRISPNDGYFAIWSLFAGEIEFERGNTGAAIDWFRAAIARGPHLARPYGWIAGAYEAAGDHAASADNIRQFRSLLGNEPADRLMDRLRKAAEGGLHHARPKLYQAVALAAQRHL
jgi:DNA-binding SARP family transcriptional activator/tetratricopeptide (TPR) repeat protein